MLDSDWFYDILELEKYLEVVKSTLNTWIWTGFMIF